MPKLIVHYDLYKGTRSDYEDLYSALARLKAVRATESTWFVSTGKWSAIQLRDHLRKFMHKMDVIGVNVLSINAGFASANLPPEAVRWMNAHLSTKKSSTR